MSEPTYMTLQPTEQALTVSACQIYAAYIMSGQVNKDPEIWMKKAISEAIQIGRWVDDQVIVPGEMS